MKELLSEKYYAQLSDEAKKFIDILIDLKSGHRTVCSELKFTLEKSRMEEEHESCFNDAMRYIQAKADEEDDL